MVKIELIYGYLTIFFKRGRINGQFTAKLCQCSDVKTAANTRLNGQRHDFLAGTNKCVLRSDIFF